MKPDIRHVSILTRAILDTSPAWCFLHADIGIVAKPRDIGLASWLCASDGQTYVNVTVSRLRMQQIDVSILATCYPCKADAPFEPIPWPVVEGEVEIEEWRGFLGEPSRLWHAGRQHDQFIAWVISGYPSLKARPGLHPAPRRQINPDGTETPVWVWEADR